jgi:hypothetical protein
MGSPHSRPDRCQQRPCTDYIHDARQIVGEHTERHLARDLRQRLHQEVRRAHPHLERAEGMLNRLAPGGAWPGDPGPADAARLRERARAAAQLLPPLRRLAQDGILW